MRHITFNGVSTKDLGITVAEADIGQAQPRIITETVPYKDGSYSFSRMDGDLHYDNRTLTYTFNVIANTAELANEKLSAVLSWVYSYDESDNTLTDDHFGGYAFTGVYVSDTPTVEYIGGARRAAQVTVTFTADPYMKLLNPIEAITSEDLNGSTDEVLVIINAGVGDNGSTPRLFAMTTEAGTYDLTEEPDFTLTNGKPYWKHERELDTVFAFPIKDIKHEFVMMGRNCGRYDGYHYLYKNGAFYSSSGTYGTATYYANETYTTSYFNSNLVKYATIIKELDTPTGYYQGMSVEFSGGSGTVTTFKADSDTTAVHIKCDSGVTWTAYATDSGKERL